MSKSITIRNVPEKTIKKWQKVRTIIKKFANVHSVAPNMIDEMCDNFLKNPDIKKYIK